MALVLIISVLFLVPISVNAEDLESENFVISNDELMVGSLDGESSSFSLIGKNSPLVGSLESDNFSQEGVVLGESIPTPTPTPTPTTDTDRSCNESCSVDSQCSGDLVCYGGRCRSDEDLDSISCPVTSTSTTTPTPTPTPGLITRFFRELLEEELPGQLFDISLEIDDTTISDIKELVARVIFTSFGTEPTPVDLTFRILDEQGKEVYFEKDEITVETEEVLAKKFENLDLPDGKYTLKLTTLYNVDVEDEFTAEFTIGEEAGFNWKLYLPIFLGIVFIFFFLLWKKRKEKEEKKKSKKRKISSFFNK